MDKLSIIIPYYDPDGAVQHLLARLLGHLYEQQNDYPETEVILVADGTDSRWIFETTRPTMIICNLAENQGASHARNVGLNSATGNYIAFIDADDDIEPDYLHTIYEIMRRGYDYALFPFIAVSEGSVSFVRDELIGNYAVWSWCFNRRIIGSERFDENLNVAEDVDWLRRVIKPELNGLRPSKAIYRYDWNANPNSLSKRFNRGDLKHKKSDTPSAS